MEVISSYVKSKYTVMRNSIDMKRDKMPQIIQLSELVMNPGAVNWSRLISSIICDNEQHLHNLSPAYSHKLHLYNNAMEP